MRKEESGDTMPVMNPDTVDQLVEKVRTKRAAPDPVDLREIRKDLGLTQSDVARALGKSPITLSRWETGAATPSPKDAQAYADLLEEIQGRAK